VLYKAPASYRLGIYINPNRAKAYNFGGKLEPKVDLFDGVNYKFNFFRTRVSDNWHLV